MDERELDELLEDDDGAYYDSHHPIMIAAKSGDVGTVRSLLRSARPGAISLLTLLQAAVIAGLVKEAHELTQLLDLDENVDYAPEGDGDSMPLSIAAARFDIPMVAMLLRIGAQTNSFSLGSKVFNTYAPLWHASRSSAEKPPPSPPPIGGLKQQTLVFGAGAGGGLGHAKPARPPPPPPLAEELEAREEIVRMLIAVGAGATLEESARPKEGGWGSGDKEPPFSMAQKDLVKRALSKTCSPAEIDSLAKLAGHFKARYAFGAAASAGDIDIAPLFTTALADLERSDAAGAGGASAEEVAEGGKGAA